MRTLLLTCASLAMLALAAGNLTGCGSSPCVELVEQVCAATDAKSCERTREAVGGDNPSPSQKQACATVLDHEQTLNATIELMKSRSAR